MSSKKNVKSAFKSSIRPPFKKSITFKNINPNANNISVTPNMNNTTNIEQKREEAKKRKIRKNLFSKRISYNKGMVYHGFNLNAKNKKDLWTTTENENAARKAFIPLDTSIKLYNPYDYRARKLNNSRKIIRFTPEEIRVIMEKEPSNLMKPLNLMHYLKVQQKIENNSTTAKKRANTMRDNLNIFNGNMYPIYENPVKNMTNEEEAKLKEEAKLNNEKKFIMAIKSKGYDIYLADLIDKEPKILTLQNLAKYTEGDLIARGIPKFKARAILQIAK